MKQDMKLVYKSCSFSIFFKIIKSKHTFPLFIFHPNHFYSINTLLYFIYFDILININSHYKIFIINKLCN